MVPRIAPGIAGNTRRKPKESIAFRGEQTLRAGREATSTHLGFLTYVAQGSRPSKWKRQIPRSGGVGAQGFFILRDLKFVFPVLPKSPTKQKLEKSRSCKIADEPDTRNTIKGANRGV